MPSFPFERIQALESAFGGRQVLEPAHRDGTVLVGPGAEGAESVANKDQPSGYAGLDAATKLKLAELPSSVVSGRTVRTILAIGADGQSQNTYNPLDAVTRHLVRLPFATTRWRLRYRNYSSLTDTLGAHPLTITGAGIGTPDFSTNADGRWVGNYTSAPTQAVAADTTPADGSDYVSPWVTDPALQFAAGVAKGLTMGVNSGGASAISFFDAAGVCYTGVGISADFLNQTTPTGGTPNANATIGDWRLEYETVTALPIVLALGDSSTGGFLGGLSSAQKAYESWPAALSARYGLPVVNLGVGSTRASTSLNAASAWVTTTDWKWLRCAAWNDADLGSAVALPDVAIISAGSNDIALDSASAATIEAALQAIIADVRALGIPRVYFGTIIPRNLVTSTQGTQETTRKSVNNWMGGMPNGISGVLDFDKALRIDQPFLIGTAAWTPGTIANGAAVTTTVTVTNANVTAQAVRTVAFSIALPAGCILTGQITSSNTVTVTLANFSGGSQTIGAGTLTVHADTSIGVGGVADSDFISNYPHPTPRGYQRMAECVGANLLLPR